MGRGGRCAGFELKGIEISPEAIQLAGELARRVHEDDGAALVVDYGKDGPYAESLVAIRGHKCSASSAAARPRRPQRTCGL
jgi:SAM-dependent MidA family methyltransferase